MLLQNHMASALKEPFREILSTVNILFLNWELPPHSFCVPLVCIGTYWIFLGVWIQGLVRRFAVLHAVYKVPGRQEPVTK